MELPNAARVVIDPRKLKDYVLSTEHPVGRFKAAYFAALGFDAKAWKALEAELRKLAIAGTVEIGEQNQYGQKYVVRGTITGPAAKVAGVTTIWIVLDGEDVPRLVTLFPED